MKKVTLFAVLCLVFWTMSAFAETQPITVDLSKLPPETAAQVLAAKKLADEGPTPTKTNVERMEEWTIFGERFADVIISMCHKLGVEVNQFINTPVGRITTIVILWKVVGVQLWSIVGGTIAWLLITGILMWSFSYFHMQRKVKTKDKEGVVTVEYIRRYEFDSNDNAVGSIIIHCIFFIAITVTCLTIVFF